MSFPDAFPSAREFPIEVKRSVEEAMELKRVEVVALVAHNWVELETGEKKAIAEVALWRVEEPAIKRSPVELIVVVADCPTLKVLAVKTSENKLVEVALVVVERVIVSPALPVKSTY